jgi:hypothetical protein
VSTPEAFDPNTVTAKDLKNQPVAVIKTELPALAEALGVTPAELFRSLTGESAPRRIDPGDVGNLRPPVELLECCNNDDW